MPHTDERVPLTDLHNLHERVDRWAEAGLYALDSISMWLPYNTVAVTAAYTTLPRDRVILCDATAGSFTVTLPDATLRKNQQPITVKMITNLTNTITVAATAGNVDGAASLPITVQYQAVTFVSDGANWWAI